jgi:nucleotide-binding universal stress UspA family protein
MKILVPVDGSPYTKRMLGYLAAHEEWLAPSNTFTILHAVPPIPARAAAVVDRETLKAHYTKEADTVFKPIKAFFAKKQALNPSYVSKVGAPADVIAQLASKGDFDLIVMGSHGHGSLANLVMGSVATRVLAHCKAPVLLVR